MDTTPDTLNFMIAGYIVFWVVTFAFIASLWLRTRNLQRDVEVLRGLAESGHRDED